MRDNQYDISQEGLLQDTIDNITVIDSDEYVRIRCITKYDNLDIEISDNILLRKIYLNNLINILIEIRDKNE